jgi:hypothetical protein
MVEGCSGSTAGFADVRWYMVPGSSFQIDGITAGGYYSRDDNYIVLSDTSAAYSASVRHEMLHAIIRKPGHPRDYFLEKCAAVVRCEGSCVADAGNWTAPSPFEVLAAESLAVTSVVTLSAEADGQRWMSLHVFATNPRGDAVMVTPIGTQTTFNASLSSDASSFNDNVLPGDPSELYFAPNAAKHWFFDVRVADAAGRYSILPGEYVARGGFGQHFGPEALIKVPR